MATAEGYALETSIDPPGLTGMVQANTASDAQVIVFIDGTSMARRLLLCKCVQQRSQEEQMNIQVLTQLSGSRKIASTMHVFCPSSQFCLARVLLWSVVNFGMIAPAMT
jgi:hypothetical protein